MSTEAENVDPRLTFNWGLEIKGLSVALCSSVSIPDVEIAQVEHSGGGAAHSTKTGGKLKFGNIVIKKIMPAITKDLWAYKWLQQVRDPETGTGQPASKYKLNGTFFHYGPDVSIIERWNCKGLWVCKITYSEHNADQDGEKLIEEVTLSCDKYGRS